MRRVALLLPLKSWRVTPPLGLLAARHAAQARGEAGVNNRAVLCRVSVYFTDDPENRRVRSSLLHHNLGGRKMTVPPTLLARAAEIIE